jgi:hypothetical protein
MERKHILSLALLFFENSNETMIVSNSPQALPRLGAGVLVDSTVGVASSSMLSTIVISGVPSGSGVPVSFIYCLHIDFSQGRVALISETYSNAPLQAGVN